VPNSNISSPAGYEGNNSTFEGIYDTTNNEVVIVREILRTEQDNDTDNIVRIERGRLLKGIYYDFDSNRQTFEVTLTGAMHSAVALGGLALAATASLLTF